MVSGWKLINTAEGPMTEEETFELRKFVAPEFIFGIDARKIAGRYAKNFGARRVLVVTDLGVAAAGWTGDVLESLREAGVIHQMLDPGFAQRLQDISGPACRSHSQVGYYQDSSGAEVFSITAGYFPGIYAEDKFGRDKFA